MVSKEDAKFNSFVRKMIEPLKRKIKCPTCGKTDTVKIYDIDRLPYYCNICKKEFRKEV